MARTVITTLNLGEKYQKAWERYARPGWEAYARKHDYDLLPISEPIETPHPESVRPLHWQKCFVLKHPEIRHYDRVLFLDSDIMINHHRAPCIVSQTPPGRIGAVAFDRYVDDDLNAYCIGTRKSNFLTYQKRKELFEQGQTAMRLPPVDLSTYYAPFLGHEDPSLPRVNSGVLVMQPAEHADILEQIYWDSFQVPDQRWVDGTCEIDQTYLTLRLLQADLIELLDPRFNVIAAFEHAIHYPFTLVTNNETLSKMCWTTMLCNSYFLHFARCASMMRFAVCNDDADMAILGLKNVFANDVVSIRHRRSRNQDHTDAP